MVKIEQVIKLIYVNPDSNATLGVTSNSLIDEVNKLLSGGWRVFSCTPMGGVGGVSTSVSTGYDSAHCNVESTKYMNKWAALVVLERTIGNHMPTPTPMPWKSSMKENSPKSP